jgi:hypothetical protein
MPRAALWCVGALLAGACVLPAKEIDPSLGESGGSGTGGAGAGTAGAGMAGAGRSGNGAGGGSAGTGLSDLREEACLEYCDIYVVACAEHPANTYEDGSDCAGICTNSDWPFGTSLTEVNSLQCRLEHAKRARDSDPEPHCYHSAAMPVGAFCAPQ